MTIGTPIGTQGSALTSISAQATAPIATRPAQTQSSAPTDSVQLSATAQKAVQSSNATAAPEPKPTLDQIIRRAADGDIAALAQLALI